MVGEKLCLGSRCPNARAQERADSFRARLAEYADNLVVSETHRRLYEEMMVLDLTSGVFNGKGLRMKFHEELARFQRTGSGFALLFMKIDSFEALKAQRGDKCVDKLLVLVAGALKGSIRPYDSVHRIKDAEFTVLLPDTDKEDDACKVAERLREKVEQQPWAPDNTNALLRVTVSIGVAVLEAKGGSETPLDSDAELKKLLEKAMRAEEKAESEGANRISLLPCSAQ